MISTEISFKPSKLITFLHSCYQDLLACLYHNFTRAVGMEISHCVLNLEFKILWTW